MKPTQHSNRSTGASIRAITLALLVVLSVWAAAGGAVAQQQQAATVDAAAATGELAIDVTQHDDESATVTVTENGSAAAGANLTVETLDGNGSYDGVGEYVTDENGTVGLPAPSEDLEIEVTAEYEGSTAETTAFLEAFEGFQVTIDGTNSPVTEGDPLTVTATVENTGETAGSQEVSLHIDSSEVDQDGAHRIVELGAGESRTIEISWDTQPGDAGNYTATVASEDDADSTSVTVMDSANFSVAIDATNSPVVEGESLTVTVTVENTGDEADSQEITLPVGGEVRDATNVTLSGGESTTVELTWETGAGDAGDHRATVSSEDDSANTSVDVEPSAFGSASLAADSGVVETYRGDVAEIGVYLNATNTTTLTIGSDDRNYHVTVTVVDDDGDGTVTVLWNTHFAGTSADESAAWSAAGGSVTDVDRTTQQLDSHIAPADYSISLSVGDTETGLGLATVTDPNNVERTLSITSAPGERSLETVTNTLSKNITGFTVASPNTTDTRSIASGDWLGLRIDAAGIQGYIAGAEDLAGDGTEGVSLTVTQTSTGPNEEADTIAVTDFETLDLGFENGTIVIVVDTRSDDFESGATYEVSFVIDEENPYVDSRVERTASFRVEEPSVTILPADEPVQVPNTESAELPGTTNVAAGTNLTVSIRSDGDGDAGGDPFELTKTTTVRNNTFSTSFDLSSQPGGQQLAVTVRHGDTGELLAEREGVMVDNAPPTVTTEEIGAYGWNGTVVGESTIFGVEAEDPDGTVESYEWTIDGEPAGSGARLDHTFDSPGDHEVRVVVTDDDGASTTASRTVAVNAPPSASIPSFSPTVGEEVTVEPEVSDPDGSIAGYEWSVDGEVVSDSRTLAYTFEEAGEYEVRLRVTDDDGTSSTATRTVEVAAPEPSPTIDTDGTPTGVETPGFGPAAGLVALAGAALLYGRRR